MKKNQWIQKIILTAPVLGLGITGIFTQVGQAESTNNAQSLNITCNNDNIPSVIASVSGDATKKNATIISFPDEYFPSQEEALASCQKTANQMQTMYNQGKTGYLTGEMYKGKPVVCLLQSRGSDCNSFDAEELFAFNQNIAEPSDALENMLSGKFQELKLVQKTVSRIYTDIQPRQWWNFFIQ